MDYRRIYYRITEIALERNWKSRRFHKDGIEPPCVVEAHHITPRSLGGIDNDSNIAVVTPREHFLLHKLLTKFNPCRQSFSALAAMRMGRYKPKLTARQFEEARRSYIIARKRPLTEDQLDKHHKLHLGKKRTEETCRKISVSKTGKQAHNKGVPATEKARLAMRVPKTLTYVTCPHCGKTGARHGMSRYHFDNCKLVSATN